jgi:hypothetical protein
MRFPELGAVRGAASPGRSQAARSFPDFERLLRKVAALHAERLKKSGREIAAALSLCYQAAAWARQMLRAQIGA